MHLKKKNLGVLNYHKLSTQKIGINELSQSKKSPHNIEKMLQVIKRNHHTKRVTFLFCLFETKFSQFLKLYKG